MYVLMVTTQVIFNTACFYKLNSSKDHEKESKYANSHFLNVFRSINKQCYLQL